jgi:nicotinamide phosphoribosyltransferase
MNLNAMLMADFYKLSHREMYPEGTELVYSTWTPRTSRLDRINEVVVFGHTAFIKKYLISFFNDNFFSKPIESIEQEYIRMVKYTLGVDSPKTEHIKELHKLGYLPLKIKALPEGTIVPVKTPVLTIENTDKRFFWLTNYIETLASCELWQASTSATVALEYRKILDKYSMMTVGNTEFVPLQGHDFSMRGMSSLDSAISSGMGHLLSFVGTDTIPAIQGAEYYYNADITKELVGTSIPATEHSIQCSYGNDLEYLKRLISEVHPNGLVSIVSDGYDFWDVIGRVLPQLKDMILSRKGGAIGDRVVIRPDSGNPVDIICGNHSAPIDSLEYKGAVECLHDIFGGTVTEKGYKLLDSHIGLIYGDAITLDRAEEICKKLESKGFASINCVFGIGSFSYQYNTRDTFGYALKSTLIIQNGKEVFIFKNPKTDDGTKKSQKGRVIVENNGKITFRDEISLQEDITSDILREVFLNGKLVVDESFSDIRKRLRE